MMDLPGPGLTSGVNTTSFGTVSSRTDKQTLPYGLDESVSEAATGKPAGAKYPNAKSRPTRNIANEERWQCLLFIDHRSPFNVLTSVMTFLRNDFPSSVW